MGATKALHCMLAIGNFSVKVKKINVSTQNKAPKSFINIPVQAPGCTTSYKVVNIYDDFDMENGEDESVDWTQAAFWDITLQFNFKKSIFNDKEAGIIKGSGKIKKT